MRKHYRSKKSFSYEIYAGTSKAAHKVLKQRGASSIGEFSVLHNLQFLHRNYGWRLGASSIRDVSSNRRITVYHAIYDKICLTDLPQSRGWVDSCWPNWYLHYYNPKKLPTFKLKYLWKYLVKRLASDDFRMLKCKFSLKLFINFWKLSRFVKTGIT